MARSTKMTTASNNRNDWFNRSSGKGRDSFQEHNQRMRAFRLAHPSNWRQRGHRVPEVQQGLPTLVRTALLQGVVLARYSAN